MGTFRTRGGRTIYLQAGGRTWRGVAKDGGRKVYFALGREKWASGELWDRFCRLSDKKGLRAAAAEMFPNKTFAEEKPKTEGLLTVGTIRRFYLENWRTIGGVKEKAAKTNAAALRRVVREALSRARGAPVTDEEADSLPLSNLNGSLAADYAAVLLRGKNGKADVLRAQFNYERNMAFACSLFSRRALLAYSTAGLAVPDVSEFLRRRGIYKRPASTFAPPDELVILTLISTAQAETVPLSERLALCLGLWAGLRREEIKAAKWSWLVSAEKKLIRVPASISKSGKDRDVWISEGFWGFLKKVDPNDFDTDQPEILGPKAEAALDAACARVRALWPQAKPLHALRKLASCFILTETKSPYEAQVWLGHDEVGTTQDYYARAKVSAAALAAWKGAFESYRPRQTTEVYDIL